jgi:hypothetical protein
VVAQRIERSEEVFLGTIDAIENVENNSDFVRGRVRFLIERVYKGRPDARFMHPFQLIKGCGWWTPKIGYGDVFFVYRFQNALWVAPQFRLDANEEMMRKAFELLEQKP